VRGKSLRTRMNNEIALEREGGKIFRKVPCIEKKSLQEY
jgi:hypothetical protein